MRWMNEAGEPSVALVYEHAGESEELYGTAGKRLGMCMARGMSPRPDGTSCEGP